MFTFFWHTWVKGHSMDTIKYLNGLTEDYGAKGWLMTCSCGKQWAR